jgi:hypothetical protein
MCEKFRDNARGWLTPKHNQSGSGEKFGESDKMDRRQSDQSRPHSAPAVAESSEITGLEFKHFIPRCYITPKEPPLWKRFHM